MHVNSPARADENQFKGEKERFLSEMSENNSRSVISIFKSVPIFLNNNAEMQCRNIMHKYLFIFMHKA